MTSATPPPNRMGRPLGTGRDWRRRLLLHHVPLALASAVLMFLFLGYSPASPPPQLDMTAESPFPQEAGPMNHSGGHASGMTTGGGRALMARSTTATGYVATVLLGMTLLVGPANLLLRRRNPISTPLARDTGTWAAIFSVGHVILGFQVHGNPGNISNLLLYFFTDGIPKTNSFGLGNWTGLAALVVVTGLLALSNDRSLRELKARRWKNLQRLNYALSRWLSCTHSSTVRCCGRHPPSRSCSSPQSSRSSSDRRWGSGCTGGGGSRAAARQPT